MLRRQLDGILKISLPPAKGLAGNCEHHVQRQMDTGILQHTHCTSNLLFPMISLQRCQRGILE